MTDQQNEIQKIRASFEESHNPFRSFEDKLEVYCDWLELQLVAERQAHEQTKKERDNYRMESAHAEMSICSILSLFRGESSDDMFRDVRDEIKKLREKLQAVEKQAVEMAEDKKRIDFLERLNANKEYTGMCILRMSINGRGWRLHETSDVNGKLTVRRAIDDSLTQQKEKEE